MAGYCIRCFAQEQGNAARIGTLQNGQAVWQRIAQKQPDIVESIVSHQQATSRHISQRRETAMKDVSLIINSIRHTQPRNLANPGPTQNISQALFLPDAARRGSIQNSPQTQYINIGTRCRKRSKQIQNPAQTQYINIIRSKENSDLLIQNSSQTQYLNALPQNLTGTIYDSATRQPLPYVTIHAMKPDRSPVTSAISDSLGKFFIQLDTGTFLLLYTCAGFRPYQSPRIIVNDSLAPILPDVFLVRDRSQLASVTVLGRRPVIEQAADGFVYNVENDVVAAGGNAVDVLRKIPMLFLSPEGNPSIRGSSNVRVFIDNKPSSIYAASVAEALQQIPADEISKVEIITHPSARYDAEGTDAVINIITKRKKYDGYNGTVRPLIASLSQELSATLKWRSGYWITNLDGSLFFNRFGSGSNLVRSANKSDLANRTNQHREQDWSQNVQIIAANFIRIIDTLKTINFGYRLRNMSGIDETTQTTAVFSEDTLTTAFVRVIPTSFTNSVHNFNAGYAAQSRNKKKEYNLLANYFIHQGTDGYFLRQLRNHQVDYRENSKGETFNSELSFQADLTHTFSRSSKLETGVKSFWRNTQVESLIDIFQPAQDKFLRDNIRSNNFEYRRGVYAVYASYLLNLKKWQLRAGLRFERTTLYTTFKDTALRIPDFNNLVPNWLARYTINDRNSVAYSFNTRIGRPYISYLNPNINYADSLNISYGNPNLLPEIIQNHNLEYTYNKSSLFASVSLGHTYIRRGFEEVRLFRADKITETTFLNMGNAKIWALNTSLRINKSKLSIGSTILVQYVSRTSPALNLTTSGFTSVYNLNWAYRFNKGYTLESYLTWEQRVIMLQQTFTGNWFYNLLITKKFNDKLSITLRADNFFGPYFYRTYEINTPDLYQRSRNYNTNRNFRIAISWKFGKQDLRAPASRNIESVD